MFMTLNHSVPDIFLLDAFDSLRVLCPHLRLILFEFYGHSAAYLYQSDMKGYKHQSSPDKSVKVNNLFHDIILARQFQNNYPQSIFLVLSNFMSSCAYYENMKVYLDKM